jgi:hypothetical protein
MELLLNIVWAVMACVSFVCWRLCWRRQKLPSAATRPRFMEFTALACALILLFFPISLSDDLHADVMVYDACSSTRRYFFALLAFHHLPSATYRAPQPVAAIACQPLDVEPTLASALQPVGNAGASSQIYGKLSNDRAPPA